MVHFQYGDVNGRSILSVIKDLGEPKDGDSGGLCPAAFYIPLEYLKINSNLTHCHMFEWEITVTQNYSASVN